MNNEIREGVKTVKENVTELTRKLEARTEEIEPTVEVLGKRGEFFQGKSLIGEFRGRQLPSSL